MRLSASFLSGMTAKITTLPDLMKMSLQVTCNQYLNATFMLNVLVSYFRDFSIQKAIATTRAKTLKTLITNTSIR